MSPLDDGDPNYMNYVPPPLTAKDEDSLYMHLSTLSLTSSQH